MNKSYVTAVLMLTCLLGIRVSASAQDSELLVVSVPFEFVTGGATLPAGKYKINRLSPASQELAFSDGGRGNAFVLPEAFDSGPAAGPRLSFEHIGGKYFLTKLRTMDGVYTMPASKEIVMLGKANSPIPSSASTPGGQ